VMSQWVTHRDARFFEDPEEFIPERWTEAFAAALPRFAYFPFGGGPRICIGSSFALTEATLLLASIVQRFHVSLAPECDAAPVISITLRPRNGLQVVLEDRSSSIQRVWSSCVYCIKARPKCLIQYNHGCATIYVALSIL
jgi:cytochrome P450